MNRMRKIELGINVGLGWMAVNSWERKRKIKREEEDKKSIYVTFHTITIIKLKFNEKNILKTQYLFYYSNNG